MQISLLLFVRSSSIYVPRKRYMLPLPKIQPAGRRAGWAWHGAGHRHGRWQMADELSEHNACHRRLQQDDEGYRRCDGDSAIAALKPSLSLGWKTPIVGKCFFVAVQMCQCSHFHNNELPVLMRRDTRPHHSPLSIIHHYLSLSQRASCNFYFLHSPLTDKCQGW